MNSPETPVTLTATQRVQLFIGQLVIQNAALQEEVDKYREQANTHAKPRQVRVVPPESSTS